MTRSKTITTIICLHCGETFRVSPSRSTSKKFCSAQCRAAYERANAPQAPNPSGLCQCGCGQPTPFAPQSNRYNGWVKGEPVRFLPGHGRRRGILPFVVRDMGYTTPCHVWQGPVNETGHARFKRDGVTKYAHVVAWEEVNGPVPPGRELHHLCEVPACINANHLEPLTKTEHRNRHPRASDYPGTAAHNEWRQKISDTKKRNDA